MASQGERLFAASIFPITLFGSLAIAVAILEAGGSPAWAFGLAMGAGYLLVIAGERLYPFVPDWNKSHGDIATDAAWAGSVVATGPVVGIASTAVGAFLGVQLSGWLGSPLWPDTWPLVAQLARGGRLIGPFGARGEQVLVRVRKDENGEVEQQALGAARFVDLVGDNGWAA